MVVLVLVVGTQQAALTIGRGREALNGTPTTLFFRREFKLNIPNKIFVEIHEGTESSPMIEPKTNNSQIQGQQSMGS